MPESEYKRCGGCGEKKAHDQFHRDRSKKDGRSSYCKDCDRERSARWRKNNPERRKEVSRSFYERNSERVTAATLRWRKENPEKYAEYQRQWSADNRERINEREKERRSLSPEKDRARDAINNAIKHGHLVRPGLCDECGGAGRPFADGRSPIQAHHADYSKPLDVEWLCRDCHLDRHYPSRGA